MRRFRAFIVPAIAGLSVAGLVTLGPAAQATTQGQMIHLNGQPVDLGGGSAEPCYAGLDFVIQGNAHDHSFTNPNGDFWENATIQGQVSLVDTGGTGNLPGTLVATGGHGEAWFGIESNNGAMVMHFKDSVFINGVRIQQNGQFVLNANGVPVVTNTTASCG